MTSPKNARALLEELFGDVSPEEEAALSEAFAMSATLVPPMTPSPALRARVLQAVERPRYAFLDRVARLLDLGAEKARALLDRVDDLASWEPSGPGVRLLHLEAGPSLANAVVGLVHVEAGTRFPRHAHIGQEYVLVLQGAIRDEDGRVLLSGDLAAMPPGSEHEFEALPGEDLLYLAVVHEGVDFGPSGGPKLLPRG